MKVGIFWYYHSAVIGAVNELADAFDGGDFIDSPLTHNRYWEVIQGQVSDLRFSEYIDVPRGWVLYDKGEQRPLVYVDKVLFKLAIKRKICAFFDLPEEVTEFERDAHYTTDEGVPNDCRVIPALRRRANCTSVERPSVYTRALRPAIRVQTCAKVHRKAIPSTARSICPQLSTPNAAHASMSQKNRLPLATA